MPRIEADGVAQDPSELFDVLRADGEPTGQVKRRADVHRDGDWHRSVHVWVAGSEDRQSFLLFQRRGLNKDTWPGRLDATVGGHYRHGETLADALREVEEEIGIEVREEDLRRLGVRLCASESEPGILDREIQDLFLFRDDRPLTAYRPDPAELDALVRLSIDDLFELFAGDVVEIAGANIRPGETSVTTVTINRDDFIPTSNYYFYRVAIAVQRALAGERHVVV
jgi:isopentenyldiphosphate isomerase